MAEDDERRRERSRSGRRDGARNARRELPIIEGEASDVTAPIAGPSDPIVFETTESPIQDESIGSNESEAIASGTAAAELLPEGSLGETMSSDERLATVNPPRSADYSSAATSDDLAPHDENRKSRLLPALAALAILALVVAGIYLFSQLSTISSETRSQFADLGTKIGALEARPVPDMTGTAKRIGDLETATTQVRDDLSAMSKRVASLAATPNAGASPEKLSQLQTQLADLKQAVTGLQSTVAALPRPDLGRIDARFSDADKRFAALQGTVTSIPRVDLGPLSGKVETLEARLKPVEAEVDAAKSPQRVAERRAAPVAVTAQAIVAAIEAGQAFPQELKALQVLGADPVKLAPLQTVAATGAPSLHDLQASLSELRDRIVAGGALAASGSYMDRLMAGAGKLVQVRPLGSVVGDTPAAIVARMGDQIGADDLAAALTEWQKLPEESRSVSKGLAERLRLRLEAEEAAKNIAANAIGAMAPPRG